MQFGGSAVLTKTVDVSKAQTQWVNQVNINRLAQSRRQLMFGVGVVERRIVHAGRIGRTGLSETGDEHG